jgi:hypothetical protein
MTEHGTLGSPAPKTFARLPSCSGRGRQLVVRLRPVVWAVGVLVTASAVGAALLSAYVDVGTLGRLPDLYEPTWAVPGKSSSGVLEGIATFLAIIGFVVAVGAPSIGGAACPGLTAVAASPPGRADAAALARAAPGIQATAGMSNVSEHT